MSSNELFDLNLSAFRPGMTVLDVGCGYGRELQRLADAGCVPIGLDPFSACVEQSRSLGFTAHQGYAEHLPFADNSFDGVISQVVLPYTNDVSTLREIARAGPVTLDDLRQVSSVGEKKLESYGAQIMALVRGQGVD